MRAKAPAAGTASRSAKVALVLGGVTCALVLVEVALRLAMPSLDFNFPTMRMTDDRFTERAGRTIEGNGVEYTFDSRGFRTIGGPPAARAVLFVGDSFTQGFGVEANRTFPARTCDRLREHGVAVGCLNAGVTGFGTAHELRLLRRLLDRSELDVAAVVLQVLPSNDLRDNWEDGGFGVEEGRLVTWDPPHVPLSVRLRVALVENGFAHSSSVVKLAANAWMRIDGFDPFDAAAAFDLEGHLLQEAVAATRRHDVPIVIVVCATAWEADPTGTRGADEARLDAVAAAVERLHVPWLDSRTVVRTAASYIPDDGHFSADGNARIGQALAEMLMPLLSRSPSADREAERE